MNNKYQKYIDYIVKDIKPPYFKYMRDHYGLKQEEYGLVLSKVYNQSVTIKDNSVYDINGNRNYYENSDGVWYKKEYDTNGNNIYYEDSDGTWHKKEYDANDNEIYYEDSNGYWAKSEYDANDKEIYYENSYGIIEDNR